MQIINRLFIIVLCAMCMETLAQTSQFTEPPAWAKEVIWYQIFVERFHNGDPSNDPTAANIDIPPMNVHAPAGDSIRRSTVASQLTADAARGGAALRHAIPS